MALRFQSYNPETGKFNRDPSVLHARKPRQAKCSDSIKALPANHNRIKNVLPSKLSFFPTPKRQGNRTASQHATNGCRLIEHTYIPNDGEVLGKDSDASPSTSTVGCDLIEESDGEIPFRSDTTPPTPANNDMDTHFLERGSSTDFGNSPPAANDMDRAGFEAPDGASLQVQEFESQEIVVVELSEEKCSTSTNQEWEVTRIIGEEEVDGDLHYLVEWVPTLEPEGNVSEGLVEKWKAQKAKMQATGMKRNRGSGTRKPRATNPNGVEKTRGQARRG